MPADLRRPIGRLAALVLAAVLALAPASAEEATPPSSGIQDALCRLIDDAARAQGLPAAFLTRLIFQESSFRPGVTSPAGAQGLAQFMPGTARERGLVDPFDPEQAVPKAAHFLAELRVRFGNWGLAAAAYNGGPNRVAAWLQARKAGETRFLPAETENYVLAVTGRTAEDWAQAAAEPGNGDGRSPPATLDGDAQGACAPTLAAIRQSRPALPAIAEAPFAPWGVQLSGNFSKARALAAFQRAAGRHRTIIGALPPMVIGTRLRSRGTRAFYRVRLPAATRAEASALCRRIQADRGACVVLRS
ncbi:lytic transglycosylase domain-containing protein [Bosea sp. (in: a-proteobacteria)]|uniref:lytic transglycosylase domain-containing protein n=1 Tax=Bosea sp. (in: a-proteobacteria) TaxID=1871050 RepID=UPI00262AB3E0|nr:transglycosylase SLT domain-containing protein [Bosea sp. (in: a-proteobacteria)]MCO5092611.1 transglycosylase SLT domain-containing protein [Bosea sp. (in: a-proteobacteria)]